VEPAGPNPRADIVRAALERGRALSPRARLGVLGALLALITLGACGALLARDTRVVLFATPLRPEQVSEVEQPASRTRTWPAATRRSGTSAR